MTYEFPFDAQTLPYSPPKPYDDGIFRKYRERPPAQILGIQLCYYSPWSGWAQPRGDAPRQLDNHPAYQLAARLGERLRVE
ncbi:hypothetical protein [Streptomyces sp. NPDC008150]|uniref:hypothetical protein n=1 Tax=Streptomyces sp. NPDC008150 TaxID=3364816 RepID=UPI0036E5FF23